MQQCKNNRLKLIFYSEWAFYLPLSTIFIAISILACLSVCRKTDNNKICKMAIQNTKRITEKWTV